MKTEDFGYIVETEKSFDEAVVSVLKAVEQKVGFYSQPTFMKPKNLVG